MTDETPIASPCVRRCRLEAAAGICGGCGRTLAEITGWKQASPAEKRAILARLAARRPADPADQPCP